LGTAAQNAVTAGNTIWFSILLKPDVDGRDLKIKFFEEHQRTFHQDEGVGLFIDNTGDSPKSVTFRAAVKNHGGNVATANATGTTHFFVGKIEFDGDSGMSNTTVSVWANPDISAGEAGLGVADSNDTGDMNYDASADDYFTYRGGSNWSGVGDEIRLGDSFADVAVPEPATLGLLGLGGVCLIARRRRA